MAQYSMHGGWRCTEQLSSTVVVVFTWTIAWRDERVLRGFYGDDDINAYFQPSFATLQQGGLVC